MTNGGNILLSEILTRDDCAKCRICCSFDSTDLWETPVISECLAEQIVNSIFPLQEFIRTDDKILLKLNREPDEDLFYCTILDKNSGCKLGDKKPFECQIWPFRIMELNKLRVITVSPVCPVVLKKPLEDIMSLAKKLAPLIFNQANNCKSIIKPYIQGYPILIVETQKFEF